MTPRPPDEGERLNEKLSHRERSAGYDPFRAVRPGKSLSFPCWPTVRARLLTDSQMGHTSFFGTSASFCTIRSNPDSKGVWP